MSGYLNEEGKGEGEVKTLTRDKGGREGQLMEGTEQCKLVCRGVREEKEGEMEGVRGACYMAATGA